MLDALVRYTGTEKQNMQAVLVDAKGKRVSELTDPSALLVSFGIGDGWTIIVNDTNFSDWSSMSEVQKMHLEYELASAKGSKFAEVKSAKTFD